MKTMIKTLLPQSLMNVMRAARDASQLSAEPKKDFVTDNLSGALDLGALLNNEQLCEGWERDHGAIMDVLEDENKAGGVNPGDRRALYMLIRALQPESVLEVGTHIGASTLYITRALMANGDAGHVTSVDIYDVNASDAAWIHVGLSAPPKDNIKIVGGEKRASFVAQPSQEFLAQTDQSFDFIFLDGDHSSVTVYNELALALKCLKPGGTILLHDYYPHGKALFPDGNIITGPFQALERVRKETPDLTVQPLGALPWQTKQGSSMTSLAIVSKKSPND